MKNKNKVEVGRVVTTTAEWVSHLLEQRPLLSYDPGMRPRARALWRRQVRRRLRQLLGIPSRLPPFLRPPRRIFSKPRNGYLLQRWILYPEPHLEIPLLMLVPDGARPAPAILCLPGSDHPKELLCGEPSPHKTANPTTLREAMALMLVREGFVTVAVDNPATAELFDRQCDDWRRHAGLLIWMGRNYEGVSTLQKLMILAWMRTLPWIDARHLGACGHSLGAKPALLTGLLDRHVRAVVWNNEAGSYRNQVLATRLKPPSPWQIVPDMIRWFDYIDLMCALAPTPLLITEGGIINDHALIRRAYAQAGAAAALEIGFMPSFRDPRKRWRGKLPRGLSPTGYWRYANITNEHYFKADQAVPWLKNILFN